MPLSACRRFLLVVALLSAIVSGAQQNLVVNPGFEERKEPPPAKKKPIDCFLARGVSGWFMPTTSSTDYFIDEGKAHSGSAFAGFIAYSEGNRNYREFIGGTFSRPLLAGETYTISFYLTFNHLSEHMVPTMSIVFLKNKPKAIGNIPVVKDTTLRVRFSGTDSEEMKTGWKEFTLEYTAQGGERYFCLGNFLTDDDTEAKKIPRTREERKKHVQGFYAYYCIDDFSVSSPNDTVSTLAAKTDSIPAKPAITAGKTIVANDIYFENGKAVLLPASYPPLYAILAAMKEQPNLKVEVGGHTSNVGNPADNQLLSEQRAKAVADFLISNGIDAGRITCKGYGSSKPIGEDVNKNRRVEFKFSE